MNIKLFTCVIAVSVTAVAFGGNKTKPERDVMKLKAKVKSMLEVEFGGDKKDTLSKNRYNFNEAGYQTYNAKYIAGGELFSQSTSDYSSDNLLMKTVNLQYSGGKKPTSKQIMFHDSKGFLTSGIWFNPPGFKFDKKEIYLNDSRGNVIEKFDSLKDDGKYLAEIYKYNSMDSMTEMDTYSQDDPDKYTSSMFSTYNSSGCRTQSVSYTLPDSDMTRDDYKCDEKNNHTEDVQYASATDGKTGKKHTEMQGKFMYIYDVNGNMTEKDEYNEKGAIKGKEVMAYDDHNNVTSDITYGWDGKVIDKHTYTYQYDGNGNWTRRTEMKNDAPGHIFERIFEYY